MEHISPHEFPLARLVSRTSPIRAIIVVEGARDAEVVMQLAKRLSIIPDGDTVVVEAGGLHRLSRILPSIIGAIVHASSVVRAIGLLVDSDDRRPHSVVESIVDSLSARGLMVTGAAQQVPECRAVWVLGLRAYHGGIVRLAVAVSGLPEVFPQLERHALEDHVLLLRVLADSRAAAEVAGARSAKGLVGPEDYELISRVDVQLLEKAFDHIACMLRVIARTLRG